MAAIAARTRDMITSMVIAMRNGSVSAEDFARMYVISDFAASISAFMVSTVPLTAPSRYFVLLSM